MPLHDADHYGAHESWRATAATLPRVYLLIAGTYTPICLLVLDGAWRLVVLVMVCVGADTAVVLKVGVAEAEP